MSLISKLFNKSKISCPRCLGKGDVDEHDIVRLGQELRWRPGKCVYCNGRGMVRSGMVSRVSADSTYLTTDIPREERARFINGDSGARQRAIFYETQIDDFIRQIEYLHFVCLLDPGKIAGFYWISNQESEASSMAEEELLDYVSRVIEHRKNKGE